MISDFEKRWDLIKCKDNKNRFKRIDNKHILDIYYGFDRFDRYVLLIISSTKPNIHISSKTIDVTINIRKDKKYATYLTLLEKNITQVFYKLCWDLFNYSRVAVDECSAIQMIQFRFKIWQKLLERQSNKLLSLKEIRGLIGELLFLKDYCFQKFGKMQSLKAWLGTEMSEKDYVFSDIWYEVKTASSKSNEIIISSLEQLHSNVLGYLTIIYLNNTTLEDKFSVTLNSIVLDISNLLYDLDEELSLFYEKLLSFGYLFDDKYDSLNFTYSNMEFFKINSSFPKLTTENISRGITKACYSINIQSINKWRVDHV